MGEFELKINKCPVPLIWLDTSVLINMTKNRLGEAKDSDSYIKEKRLFDFIYQTVRKEKLICPQADQLEEVTHSFREIQETQSMLSRGIHLRHGDDIKDIQILGAMNTYINKMKVIEVNYQDAFENGPIIELNKHHGMVVDVYGNKSERVLAKERDRKSQYLEMYNALKKSRREAKITFEEQLEVEFTGEYQAVLKTLRKCLDFLCGVRFPTEEDLSQITALTSLLKSWDRLGGNPQGLNGLFSFLTSAEWRQTPCNDIPAHLFAKLVTRDGNVKPGDPKDVSQLTFALAYCDYVVCDRAMWNLIMELELDEKYEVRVFTIANVDEIIHIIVNDTIKVSH